MNQPPLNPDAFDAAWEALYEAFSGRIGDLNGNDCERMAETAIQAYLAAALPEVTSVEELDQLPMHTYVQGADGFKHAKDWNGGWHLIVNRPSSAPHLSGSIELPARVLYRPSERP